MAGIYIHYIRQQYEMRANVYSVKSFIQLPPPLLLFFSSFPLKYSVYACL